MTEIAENVATFLRDAEESFRAGRYPEAEPGYRRVLALDPASRKARNGFGMTLYALGRFAEAERVYRDLLSQNPDDPVALHNLGNALASRRQLKEAEGAFREALRLKPNLPDTHAGLGMALLTRGRFEQGFAEYDWRWRSRQMADEARRWTVARWRGEPLEGRTLLVHAEQGFGDTLQFCRFTRLIQGGRVVLEVPPALTRLLHNVEGVAQVVTRADPLPQFDLHCPLMSLPLALQTTLKDLPTQVPYLRADPAEVERYRNRLAELPGLKVGLVWAARLNPRTAIADARRSVSLDRLSPLGEIAGVSFVSLQTGSAAAEINTAGSQLRPFAVELRDFADTAAVIECLDLVITVDTAVVHLAGALGKRVWLLNRFDASWRWLEGREDSPWYPSLRQFRQPSSGDWAPVIERVHRSLRAIAAGQVLSASELAQRALKHFETHEDLEAEALYEHILTRDARNAEAWNMRCRMAHRAKRLEEALAYSKLTLDRDDTKAHYHHHHGKLLCELRRYTEAEASFRKVLSLGQPRVLNDLGQMAHTLGRIGPAEECFREAVRLEPNNALALSNLGNVMRSRDRFVEAEAIYREAARRDPKLQEPYANLGVLLAEQGRFDEALTWYDEAIRRRPEQPETHTNRAMTQLLAGRFEQGWAEYEWRWRTAHFADIVRNFSVPMWRGEPLANKELFVHHEQGFGDTLQFCRYIPMVKDARIILEVPAPLVRLLSRLPGITRVVTSGRPLPSFDLHCPMLSFPGVFGTTVSSVPASVPYLSADPAEVSTWRQRIESLPGLKVGLVWAGEWRPHLAAVDKRRSISLEMLAPLAEVAGVSFISLQKGKAAKQAKSPPPGMQLHDFTAELHDFAATAALMECLDLIISVDTAPAHLAGALGKPVWLLNRFETCWRWMRDRDDSPWYPTLRQFRQSRPGEWRPVIPKLRDALLAFAGARRRAAPAGTLEKAP